MRWIPAALLLCAPAVVLAAEAPPDWAFLARAPGVQTGPEDTQPRHRPGSNKAYTQAQIDDIFNPPDWYPDEHPPMPELVSHGKQPVVHGCAQCHLTTGRGHPESANHRRTARRLYRGADRRIQEWLAHEFASRQLGHDHLCKGSQG